MKEVYVRQTLQIFLGGCLLLSMGCDAWNVLVMSPEIPPYRARYNATINLESPTTLELAEDGGELTFSVTISEKPFDNILLPISLSDPTQGQTDISSLTFTPDNWDKPQTITLKGTDDQRRDPGAEFSFIVGPGVSNAPGFGEIPAVSVQLTSIDGVCGNAIVDGEETCEPREEEPVCVYGARTCQSRCSDMCQTVEQTAVYCGDGIVQEEHGESCDDMNDDNTDTCTTSCTPCGNGKLDDGETCDDGENPSSNGDGCSSTCQTEPLWHCELGEACYRRIDKPTEPKLISDFFGAPIASSEDIVAVAAPGVDDSAQDAGAVFVYKKDDMASSGFKYLGRITIPADHNRPGAAFGMSVAVDDHLIAVSALNGERSGESAVYMYRVNDNDTISSLYGSTREFSAPRNFQENWGRIISLCAGNLFVPVAKSTNDDAHVLVYSSPDQSFTDTVSEYKIYPADRSPKFGWMLECTDEHLAIIDTNDAQGSKVYWASTSDLSRVDGQDLELEPVWTGAAGVDDKFGMRSRPSIHGDHLLVGAEQKGGTGQAILFDLSVLPQGDLDANRTTIAPSSRDAADGDKCGHTVYLTETHMYLSCIAAMDYNGRVLAIDRTTYETTDRFESRLDPQPDQGFGWRLEHTNGTLFVSATGANTHDKNAGTVFMFSHP